MSQLNTNANVSIFSAITGTAKRALNVVDNGLAMVDNAFIAGERVTYIAASKASNMADISDINDSITMLAVRKELEDKKKQLGIVVDANGVMTFGE